MGDEFHYFFKCSFFETERHKYLPAEFLETNLNESLEQLLSVQDTHSLIGIANFANVIRELFDHQDDWDREEF